MAIIISEIYPAPHSGSEEWVELYNSGTQNVDLSTYILKDVKNNTIVIPVSSIKPMDYLIATSSGVLNNTGDTLILWDGTQTVYTAEYSENIDADHSLVQCMGAWIQTQDITPGFENPYCEKPKASITPQSTESPERPSTQKNPTPTLFTSPTATVTAQPTHKLPAHVLSFSDKHAPTITHKATLSLRPTQALQEMTFRNDQYFASLYFAAFLLLVGGIGYFTYRVVQFLNTSYAKNDLEIDT